MKSAFERAMERFGGELQHYTDEQKEQLAEIDRRYDAKQAEAKLNAEQRLKSAGGDPAEQQRVRDDLRVELASIEERRERDKKQVRESGETSRQDEPR